ncbi:hypothetical protein [Neisseria lactamica]|uniref:PilS cassette n=1 Tax=Neisseria lactamica ATCC 23970 TaxID=546265 RepID=D0WCK8_NEILA|nr:hypothetical protein [Neisseria lactamica]EEZ74707.1 hypothetical protein NEILACOT_05290 [Neisseria lactamica ATCC 23970]
MPSEIRLVPIVHAKTENKGGNLKFRHFRSGGNPVCPVPVVFRSVTFEPSFPRRRESRISMPQEFIGKNSNLTAVIPTKVGI